MIPTTLIEKVISLAQKTALHSWEYSTVFEALLEYHDPTHSIFHNPFPMHDIPSLKFEEVPALQYVKPFIRTDSTKLCEGNGSSSDPASLGIPALLLSKTTLPNAKLYLHATTSQLTTLLTSTPRHPNTAISHRDSYASLWADFIYMVPPFLAYYGVYTNSIDLVRESVRQCELYCKVLRADNGAWKHIANADESGDRERRDEGLWCTSNAWAAAGMCRCLATCRASRFREDTQREQTVLVVMIRDILAAAVKDDTDSSGLLRNYLDDENWFGEVAGTALMAATVYRMAVLEPGLFGEEYTAWASRKLEVVGEHIDGETGVAAPVVNSLREGQRTPLDGVNPEAQAFLVLLYAAWRDWKDVRGGEGS